MTTTAQYPEHEKLKALGERREAVQEFLDWLESRGWVIAADSGRYAGYGGDTDYRAVRESRQSIMAMFFDIDLTKLDDEKRAMLDTLRELNAR